VVPLGPPRSRSRSRRPVRLVPWKHASAASGPNKLSLLYISPDLSRPFELPRVLHGRTCEGGSAGGHHHLRLLAAHRPMAPRRLNCRRDHARRERARFSLYPRVRGLVRDVSYYYCDMQPPVVDLSTPRCTGSNGRGNNAWQLYETDKWDRYPSPINKHSLLECTSRSRSSDLSPPPPRSSRANPPLSERVGVFPANFADASPRCFAGCLHGMRRRKGKGRGSTG